MELTQDGTTVVNCAETGFIQHVQSRLERSGFSFSHGSLFSSTEVLPNVIASCSLFGVIPMLSSLSGVEYLINDASYDTSFFYTYICFIFHLKVIFTNITIS